MPFLIRQLFVPVLAGSFFAQAACLADPPKPVTEAASSPEIRSSSIQLEILGRQTCGGLGACQGAALHDGFVYLYGDLYKKDRQSGPGVIRQYAVEISEQDIPCLRDTGFQILLTRNGENVINHPTGLTWNCTFGTYLGDTVTKTKKGTIYHLNWSQMLIDGNLDHAIMNVIDDDLAIQGCRPEFVRYKNQWRLATADYGEVKNAIRLYDPAHLAKAKSTSERSILCEQFPCTPWVQQLHWIDSDGLLMIVQNQIEGRRWRLTSARLRNPESKEIASIPPFDEIPDLTELEGFTMLDREYCVLVTSSPEENVTIARLKIQSTEN